MPSYSYGPPCSLATGVSCHHSCACMDVCVSTFRIEVELVVMVLQRASGCASMHANCRGQRSGTALLVSGHACNECIAQHMACDVQQQNAGIPGRCRVLPLGNAWLWELEMAHMQDQGRACLNAAAGRDEHVEGVDEQARRAEGCIDEVLSDSQCAGARGQRLCQVELFRRRPVTPALHQHTYPGCVNSVC